MPAKQINIKSNIDDSILDIDIFEIRTTYSPTFNNIDKQSNISLEYIKLLGKEKNEKNLNLLLDL
jgi:hypothetical protein